jgi:predicted PurR-regulated permease PerM
MFSFDDHTGNVVTTVALFAGVAAIVYLARGALLILLLSILLAYLLEPAVNLLQRHSRLGRKNRDWAIVQVCLIGTLVLGSLGYELGPPLAGQLKKLNAAAAEILQSPSGGQAAGTSEGQHGLSGAQQRRLRDFLARHHDFIAHAVERGAASIAYVAASAVWLFAVPILAVFVLRDGRQMVDAIIQAGGRREDRTVVRRIVQKVDTMLAKYIRSQLALAGLSFGFYSLSMLVLRVHPLF